MNINAYVCVMLSLLLISCGKTHLRPDELRSYINDESNGLMKIAKVENVSAQVSYHPTDLIVFQQIPTNTHLSQHDVEKSRAQYIPYLYFVLSLSNDGNEAIHALNSEAYGDVLQTLSFSMSQYVSLTTASMDTIPVRDFMLNRTFGMSSSTDLLFAFSREKVINQEWIQFNLNEFGLGIGNQRFRFNMKDIEAIPTIEFPAVAATY